MSKQRKYIKIATIIPEEWVNKIIKRMETKGYYSISEYVRDLIRDDLANNHYKAI